MMKRPSVPLALMSLILTTACASIFEDYDKKLLENKEFDQKVKITQAEYQIPWSQPIKNKPVQSLKTAQTKAKKVEKKEAAKAQAASEASASVTPEKIKPHLPTTEDGAGFNGRQPLVNPFRVGELVTYSASYFGMEAGKITIGIRPTVDVNGSPSYHFAFTAKSSSVFSVVYTIDDFAETYMDQEKMVPSSYLIKARESKQVKDVRAFFDWDKMNARMWEKTIKKGKAPDEKNIDWPLLPYSQNIFSVAFYVRCFDFKVGKVLAVPVAHEGKNIIMKAKVVREEKLKTPMGLIDTWVIKPEFTIDGVFKPVGDIHIWFTKDERKFLVRIESKIKIGTVVISAQDIKK